MQARHEIDDEPPVTAEYVPAAQLTHVVASEAPSAVEKVPTKQLVQLDCPDIA